MINKWDPVGRRILREQRRGRAAPVAIGLLGEVRPLWKVVAVDLSLLPLEGGWRNVMVTFQNTQIGLASRSVVRRYAVHPDLLVEFVFRAKWLQPFFPPEASSKM